MTNLLMDKETEQIIDSRIIHVGERPITFERYLEMGQGQYVELVNGVIVEKPMVQWDHEWCMRWLYQVVGIYVKRRGLGEMVSSRIVVKIGGHAGRMPDLLFIKKDNFAIVQQKAVYGAPDLVIEIVSPNDRVSHLRELETDYFGIGVPELLFIDLRRQEIRHLLLRENEYEETHITSGAISFESIEGLTLQAEWILQEPRPDELDTVQALLASSPS